MRAFLPAKATPGHNSMMNFASKKAKIFSYPSAIAYKKQSVLLAPLSFWLSASLSLSFKFIS